MRYVINKFFILIFLSLPICTYAAEEAKIKIIKKQILASGFMPVRLLYQNPDENLAKIGKIIFASKGLSLFGGMSCRTCHLDKFGSADGIPNAAAIRGHGKGVKRLLSGAKQVPRNTLALWGNGSKGFNIFFWDGKVDFSTTKKISQFGKQAPSSDPLLTTVHLPVVEIREMLDENEFIRKYKVESVKKSKIVYQEITKNLIKTEPKAGAMLANALGKDINSLEYIDIARSIASFIRTEFRLKPTKLEKFMEGEATLNKKELDGALTFYGKGGCATCHSGPHFSDFKFYTIAFPQLGFGKNGFGVDYGRYNVTFNPKDLYKFRTPSLYNVEKTAPYGHSGSARTLEEAVIAHYDPLKIIDLRKLDALERHEFYKRLTLNDASNKVNFLTLDEVKSLVSFLKTLSF